MNSNGSNDGNAGRVEICYQGWQWPQWESINDDQWDDRDARVACAQLGFAREGIPSCKKCQTNHCMLTIGKIITILNQRIRMCMHNS